MEKEIRVSVKYVNTSEEVWKDLKDRFGKESAPRAYELKQLLSSTRQDGASVSAYYTKLRALWDEMGSVISIPKCTCNGCTCSQGKRLMELRDKERLYEFLLGLDKEYSTIRTQILAMKPTPTLGEAYHLDAEDEQQRSISSGRKTGVDVAAFQASTRREGVTTGRMKTGQKTTRKPITDKADQHCDFCDKDGHVKKGCFKRIGYPEWWPGKGKTEKSKPRAALVESEESPVTGLSKEQYQQFLHLFAEKNPSKQGGAGPMVNMAGRLSEGLK
ncbi:hypothetical protein K2173_010386 [Erythroxylum novogranatense]|uniref:Retrotransposon gag domain-containing protein n=1 Tax=Erythroxylum novogranatense TaxID=1862640 RepID=A0AAV8TDI7_9ROSI|nr:hypothetical protein K2173_010386 [Erythroxylum novogranatense]